MAGVSVSVSNQDLNDLAKIMYLESRGNPELLDLAHVAETVVNRAADVNGYFPKTISGVVLEPGQFEPVTVGRFDAAPPPTDAQLAQALAIMDTYGDPRNAGLKTNAAFFENAAITAQRGTGLTAHLNEQQKEDMIVFTETPRYEGEGVHTFMGVGLYDPNFNRTSKEIPDWSPEYSIDPARLQELRNHPAYAEMAQAITTGRGHMPEVTNDMNAAGAATGLSLPPEVTTIANDFMVRQNPEDQAFGQQLMAIAEQYNNRQITDENQVKEAIEAMQARSQQVLQQNNVPIHGRTWMLSTQMGAHSASAFYHADDNAIVGEVPGINPGSLEAFAAQMQAAGIQWEGDFSTLTVGQAKQLADQFYNHQTQQAADLAQQSQNGTLDPNNPFAGDMDFFGMLTEMLGPEMGGFLGMLMTVVSLIASGQEASGEALSDHPGEELSSPASTPPDQPINQEQTTSTELQLSGSQEAIDEATTGLIANDVSSGEVGDELVLGADHASLPAQQRSTVSTPSYVS